MRRVAVLAVGVVMAAGVLVPTSSAADAAENQERVARDAPGRRPDATIRLAGRRGYVGDDVYGGARDQRVCAGLRGSDRKVTILVRVQNDGSRDDEYAVISGILTVNDTEVDVLLPPGDGLLAVPAGGARKVRVVVRAEAGGLRGTVASGALRVVSTGERWRKDTVGFEVQVLSRDAPGCR